MRKLLVVLLAIIVLMFAEYRFIMTNLRPFQADDGTFCIEFLGQVDEYH